MFRQHHFGIQMEVSYCSILSRATNDEFDFEGCSGRSRNIQLIEQEAALPLKCNTLRETLYT